MSVVLLDGDSGIAAMGKDCGMDDKWWDEFDATVNGVFKGGGAKGLLYAGALQAMVDRKRWFRAVGGASAGAITAALIASGMTVDQLKTAVPSALAGVRKMPLGDLVGSPVLRTIRLERWLRTTLIAQLNTFGVDVEDGADPTFAMLYEATNIELYVVAVDVALRQPVVFSSHTTPSLSVVSAIIASSAIPMAFRPGRLLRENPDGTQVVHRLMDGGVWANYPVFVFKDASFRAHHGLAPVPAESTTVGFTLDSGVAVDPTVPVRFISADDPHWSLKKDRGAGLPWLLRNGPMRLYLMTVVPLVIVLQMFYSVDNGGLTAFRDWSTRDGVSPIITNSAAFFNGFFTHFEIGLWIVLIVLTTIALVMAFIGATLFDSGGPALKTLMAVGTDVPYWVGTTPGDNVVRLRVPAGLSTMSFKLKDDVRKKAVCNATVEAGPQLDAIFGTDAP